MKSFSNITWHIQSLVDLSWNETLYAYFSLRQPNLDVVMAVVWRDLLIEEGDLYKWLDVDRRKVPNSYVWKQYVKQWLFYLMARCSGFLASFSSNLLQDYDLPS